MQSWTRRLGLLVLAIGTVAAAGCNGGGPDRSAAGVLRLEFWHTRRREQEQLLQKLCKDFGAAHPGVEVVPVFQGSYDDLNKKIRAGIQAKSLPALSVAYESHATEYAKSDAIVPLDDLVADRQIGLTEEDLQDIPPLYLQSNRFAQFGGKLLSFPFTKSNLVLYYNKTLMKRAGIEAPPATWIEFERQAGVLSKILGQPAFSFMADPSTLDGMIYSHGGEVFDPAGQKTGFGSAEAVATMGLLRRMALARTLAEDAADDVRGLFTAQSRAFVLDSSSSRAGLEEQIGSKFDWDVAVIPHAEGVKPVTVMYGPNICIFRTTPEQQRAAWQFVAWFTSPPITAEWARGTGYLPVRRSAVDQPEMKAFYAANSRALHVYEILKHAKGEPNVIGWQEVRQLLETAARSIVSGRADPATTALKLQRDADRVLAEANR